MWARVRCTYVSFSKNFFFLATGYNLDAPNTIASVKFSSKNTVLEFENLDK